MRRSRRKISAHRLIYWAVEDGFTGRGATAEYRKYYPDPDLWFARKIAERFPPEQYRRVADVAGGYGQTAQALKKVGYEVVVTFDPHGVRRKGVTLRKRPYLVRDARDFDLIVGFRPCGASQKLVRSGKFRPVAMIPCFCRSVWPPLLRARRMRARGPKPGTFREWRRLFPEPFAGATKFFHTCGVDFDRVGAAFLSKPPAEAA